MLFRLSFRALILQNNGWKINFLIKKGVDGRIIFAEV